jgi:hypothetical protein
MFDPAFYLTIAAATLAAVAMLTFAGLSGFRGWLELKRQMIVRGGDGEGGVPSAGARIEIADLKERIRKLEAIAAGVEL